MLQDSESKRRLPAHSGVMRSPIREIAYTTRSILKMFEDRKCIGRDGRGRAARWALEMKGVMLPRRDAVDADDDTGWAGVQREARQRTGDTYRLRKRRG